MTGLDTNILVRIFVNDDPAQTRKARKALEKLEQNDDPAFISDIVLLETVWVLEAAYETDRADILHAIESLTHVSAFTFRNVDLVHEFIRESRLSSIDLADILIGLKAEENGCETTLTFDKAAGKHRLFSFLS